ncbi:MAG: efflux RND transporter permease subunit [Balneolaceae bacterium]|nr:efflux RND transporter permease subunit [Balneolaceae bacterium]
MSVPYQNSTPKEIEHNITRPIEEAISTISGLEEISSTSSENQAGIFVRFQNGFRYRPESDGSEGEDRRRSQSVAGGYGAVLHQ